MRSRTAVALVAILAPGLHAATNPHMTFQPAPEFLLVPGKAGNLELGQKVDDVYARFGRDRVRLVDLFLEGMFTPALQIHPPDAGAEPSLIAPIREWPCASFSVYGISVRDNRYRTSDGIGVGSTLRDIQLKYEATIGWGEGDRIAHVPVIGMTFVMDDSSGATDSWRVKSVWLIPQPPQVRQARCPHLGPIGKVGQAINHRLRQPATPWAIVDRR
jgi:hypothetical protein